jgi:protease IV
MNPHFKLISQLARQIWAIDASELKVWSPLASNLLSGRVPEATSELKPMSWNNITSEGKSSNDLNKDHVSVFTVSGPMLRYGDICSYGTEDIASQISASASNEKNKGIVIKFDTGGGTVDSVIPLINAIKKVKAAGKLVHAFVDTAALSAGYRVACECDKVILSNNMAQVGSIGVLIRIPDFDKQDLEKNMLNIVEIYAPESSDKNLPYREALKGNVELIRNEMLSPYAQDFINSVKSARSEKLQLETPGLLSGKVFFASDAITNGLADEINTSLEDVVNQFFKSNNSNFNFNQMEDNNKKPSFAERIKEFFGFAPVDLQARLNAAAKMETENSALKAENDKLKADLDVASKQLLEKQTEIDTLRKADGAKTANLPANTDVNLTTKEFGPVAKETLTHQENLELIRNKYFTEK